MPCPYFSLLLPAAIPTHRKTAALRAATEAVIASGDIELIGEWGTVLEIAGHGGIPIAPMTQGKLAMVPLLHHDSRPSVLLPLCGALMPAWQGASCWHNKFCTDIRCSTDVPAL